MLKNDHVFFWATVESLNPLTVRRDGETAPMGVAPSSLVDPASLSVGSRVWCQLHNRRALVIGVAGGIPEYVPPKPEPLVGPWRNLVLSSNAHDWSGTAQYRTVPRGVEIYVQVSAGNGTPSDNYVCGFSSSSGITFRENWYAACLGSGSSVGKFAAQPNSSTRNFLAYHNNKYLRVSAVIPDYCLNGV